MKMIFIFSVSFMILFGGSNVWGEDKCESPIWRIGYKWVTESEDKKKTKLEVMDITKDGYFLQTEREDPLSALRIIKTGNVYNKETLNSIYEFDEGGNKVRASSSSQKYFNFPLFVGKKWKDEVSGFSVTGKRVTYYVEFQVERKEDLSIAIGKFQTYKIICDSSADFGARKMETGRMISWYSPEAKWWIKREYKQSNYWKKTPSNWVLTEYKLEGK